MSWKFLNIKVLLFKKCNFSSAVLLPYWSGEKRVQGSLLLTDCDHTRHFKIGSWNHMRCTGNTIIKDVLRQRCAHWKTIHILVMGDGVNSKPWEFIRNRAWMNHRADSSFVPSQWETALLCNNISHWLGASLESALNNRIWWLCLVPISTTRSARYLGLYKENTFYEQWHQIP